MCMPTTSACVSHAAAVASFGACGGELKNSLDRFTARNSRDLFLG